MSKRNRSKRDGAEIIIKGKNVKIRGDVVGRDKISTNQGYGNTEILARFGLIKQMIESQNQNKDELQDIVAKIEKEVCKGENANTNKIDKWLRFLAEMSDDIFQVTVNTLANPISGLATAVQLIARKAKEERKPA